MPNTQMPAGVISASIVATPVHTDAPGVFRGMSRTNRFFMRLAWRHPWLSELNTRFLGSVIRRGPTRYIRVMKHKVHEIDRRILKEHGIGEMLAAAFAEALHAGAQGRADDMSANHGHRWGFSLAEISAPVHVWACELDLSVPPAMARYLCEQIPNCKLTPALSSSLANSY